jgi:hypothetical protein
MDKHIEEIGGQCHCGGVKFRVRLQDGLNTALRCNCSYCRMRGAVVVFARVGSLDILAGADLLTTYQFNTGTAKHYFCSRCGIYTHHQRRFDPNLYAVNVACLDGLSPYDFDEVPIVDGANHPRDTGEKEMRVVAVQRIEKR